jgi:AraC family transcriptional regulator
MSRYRFTRSFTRALGMPPYRYVAKCRIESAKALLRTSRTPLSDIALALGFATPNHFSYVFRKTVGVTPSSYRRTFVA